MEAYLDNKGIRPLLTDIVIELSKHMPDQPIPFIISFLSQRMQEETKASTASSWQLSSSTEAVRLRSLSDIIGQIDEDNRRHSLHRVGGSRRRAIFSEPIDLEAFSSKKSMPKTPEQKLKLESSLNGNIFFSRLEREEQTQVFDAMFQVHHPAGATIIRQGDEGDNFYVIDEGECEIYVNREDGPPELVATVGRNGSFGELALIYGSPRAATVKSTTPVSLWAIDRGTYRAILMSVTMKKRKVYEDFLAKVDILESLTPWERSIVADALEPITFHPGQKIIHEGESGDTFFILLEGSVTVTKGEAQLGRLCVSNYFGEIALLKNTPRAATITADDTVKCAMLDRERFNRVMGPCQDLLRRNITRYHK
ncbi:cAMP-dependent protein kinase type I-alpha regulatory subunit-like [Planoprotostelium fungivorum]|uniref:cAMP-dependent protein kinase type I-alpha regulatory subunit-like n=1 Tax=Planoprotostelium fungivorum TaxID=1890364 RepID=A0A2P6NH53_9EUKA|nr:cAMP-dependent protein kinase type I-alpha regulatory subunit-like [Planoprotostelium fungivorum]